MSSNMLTNNLMGLDRNRIEQLVREAVVTQLGGTPAKATAPGQPNPLLVNVSARHAHVTQEDLERLFGKGHKLKVFKTLISGWVLCSRRNCNYHRA